jgi:preprotein translocase subunit SecA
VEDAVEAYETKEAAVGEGVMRELERAVLLNITDTKWREHLYEMDYLQEGIHLRAYGQRDPLTEYRREAFSMFEELVGSIRRDFVKYIYRVELVRQDQQRPRAPQRTQENKAEVESGSGGAAQEPVNTGASQQAVSDKVPRNAPCPCGSGKKYKKCHGLEV